MKSYVDYIYCSPITDGKEMRNFFNNFEIGDSVTVRGESFLYGKGTVVEILNNCNKAVVRFPDGISYIPVDKLKFV